MTKPQGKIGFLFHLGHGHYTQFLNFQECATQTQKERAEWIPLPGDKSGDPIANLSFIPAGVRYRRHQLWHVAQGVARHPEWDALFFANMQIAMLPFLRKYPSYYYTDLSPSLKRELAPWYDHQLTDNPVKNALKLHLEKKLYAACKGIFTMSRWSANGIMHDFQVPSEKMHVALPGANLNRWHFVDRSDRANNRVVKILMVGGQFKLKGGELVLEWAKTTTATNWELDIVTWPGELPEWVRECLGNPANDAKVSASLTPHLPNVRIHCGVRANTPEIMQLFADADIFCLPTQADGSSIASLEAMATGLPTLAGKVGGIPELIREGETGFLLERGSASDLKQKLEALIQDRSLRLNIGNAARKSCEEFYNVPRQLTQIYEVLDKER